MGFTQFVMRSTKLVDSFFKAYFLSDDWTGNFSTSFCCLSELYKISEQAHSFHSGVLVQHHPGVIHQSPHFRDPSNDWHVRTGCH
ncbi:hypothetical protein FGIG_01723 [Fasciola gigantica]|uniref:Uncharacterized protein n=1 Tax=Fasciola gigantica TaxID=46835 RepID=A0A504Y8N0_FASGI|nr:hypothetical protein FGIG_01723 [Fasciola gigantica]